MAQIPTYILAPNFSFAAELENRGGLQNDVNGRTPWLGNIIADPFDPRRVLDDGGMSDGDSTMTTVCITTESDNMYSRTKGHSLSTSLWTSFLNIASAEVGRDAAKSRHVTYSMKNLETRYLRDDPTEEEITRRVEASPRIRAAMSAGLFGNKPVYMITGIKIAKGLDVSTFKEREIGGVVGAGATVTPDGSVSVGAKLGGSRWHSKETSYKAENDIIFAYQLHVIRPRGWRNKGLKVGLLKSDAAFLGAHDESRNTFEAGPAVKEDFEMLLSEWIEKGEIRMLDIESDVDAGAGKVACLYDTSAVEH